LRIAANASSVTHLRCTLPYITPFKTRPVCLVNFKSPSRRKAPHHLHLLGYASYLPNETETAERRHEPKISKNTSSSKGEVSGIVRQLCSQLDVDKEWRGSFWRVLFCLSLCESGEAAKPSTSCNLNQDSNNCN